MLRPSLRPAIRPRIALVVVASHEDTENAASLRIRAAPKATQFRHIRNGLACNSSARDFVVS